MDEDLALFRYLVVGLLDEQVRVCQVVPEGLADEAVGGFCDRVTWQDSSWPMLRNHRLGRLADRLEDMGVDLIHALDGRVWTGAARLARELELPIILGASHALDLPLAARLGRLKHLTRVAFVASTEPLSEAIRTKLDPEALVEYVPPGVHFPDSPTTRGLEQGALCAVVSGDGRYDAQYEALIPALREVVDLYPQAQFFFDGQGADQRTLWQAAQQYGLHANMSLVPRRVGHREILLRADVLIQPQALGRSRTLTLGAMAHGVPVLAQADPWLDYLIDQQTALVVEQPDPARWARLIRLMIEDPVASQGLVDRARQWVHETHLAANQVSQILRLYRQMVGETIKFPTPQA